MIGIGIRRSSRHVSGNLGAVSDYMSVGRGHMPEVWGELWKSAIAQ